MIKAEAHKLSSNFINGWDVKPFLEEQQELMDMPYKGDKKWDKPALDRWIKLYFDVTNNWTRFNHKDLRELTSLIARSCVFVEDTALFESYKKVIITMFVIPDLDVLYGLESIFGAIKFKMSKEQQAEIKRLFERVRQSWKQPWEK